MKFTVVNSNTLQAFWIGMGKLSTFAIGIISAMILSRYFEKAEYGTYRQIIYVYSTLLVVFSVGLPKSFSYFLPQQSPEQGKDIVTKINKVFFVIGAIFSMFLFLASPVIATILKNPELETGIRLFSPIPFLLMPTLGIEGIFAALRKSHIIAIYHVSTKLFMLLAITLPVIIFKGDYKTAIYGWFVSSVLTFLLANYLKSQPYRKLKSVRSDYSLKQIFSYTFPIMTASLYGIALRFADQFFISRYFGPETFAEFSNGFIEIPFVLMITGATSTVLTPLYAKHLNQEGGIKIVIQNWRNALIKSATLIYPLVIFMMFFAKETMLVMYGEKYLASGTYFNIALVINFFDIIVIGSLLFAMGETKFYARMFLISVFIIWGVDYILVELFMNPFLIAAFSVFLRIVRIIIFLVFISKKFAVDFLELIPLVYFIKIIGHSLAIMMVIKLTLNFTNIDIPVLLLLILSFGVFILTMVGTQKLVKIDYLTTVKTLKKSISKK